MYSLTSKTEKEFKNLEKEYIDNLYYLETKTTIDNIKKNIYIDCSQIYVTNTINILDIKKTNSIELKQKINNLFLNIEFQKKNEKNIKKLYENTILDKWKNIYKYYKKHK